MSRCRRPSAAAAAALAVLLSLLLVAPPPSSFFAAAQAPPSPPFWSYAVKLSTGEIQIVWPLEPGTAPSDYLVEACADGPACQARSPAVAGSGANPAAATAAAPPCAACLSELSLVAPAPASPFTFYRVSLVISGAEAAAAPPAYPLADAGNAAENLFVAPAPRGSDSSGGGGGGGGGAPCGSWASPCASIQPALNKLPADPTAPAASVWVAPGYYAGASNGDLSFGGKKGIVRSLAGKEATLLDGEWQRRLFVFSSFESPQSVIMGLSLTRGFSHLDPNDIRGGGCVLIDSASPTLFDLDLSYCTTVDLTTMIGGGDGGGVGVINRANLFNNGMPLVAPTIAKVSIKHSFGWAFAGGISFVDAGVIAQDLVIEDSVALLPGGGMGGGIVGLRGFVAASNLRISRCGCQFTGGGFHFGSVWTVDASTGGLGPIKDFVVEDCFSGMNSGGLSVIAGGDVKLANGVVRRNRAGFFGGGSLLMFTSLAVQNVSFDSNVGPYGGGAIYDTSASLSVDNCTFSGNTAADGGALTLVKSPDAAAFPMHVSVSSSIFEDNRATGIYGGAVLVASTDSLAVSGARFRGNVATKGGAAKVRNDLKDAGAALGNVTFAGCAFDDNVAQFGGGVHVDGGGSVAVSSTNFTANAASAAGGGVAVGDGGALVAAGARFSSNGNSSCVSPPGAGGALAVGLDDFKPYAGCSAPATVPPSAQVSDSFFEGNVAASAGGAVAVRSGTLTLSDSGVSGNAVTGSSASKLALGASSIDLKGLAVAEAVAAGNLSSSAASNSSSPAFAAFFTNLTIADADLSSPPAGNPRARGGGVFVGGSCGASGACTSATAVLQNVTLLQNSAAEAGGGAFYDGTGSAASALVVAGGAVRGNRAPEGSAGGGGVGGGVAVVGRGFSLEGVAVSANAARFGGGLFVSADLSPPAAAGGAGGGGGAGGAVDEGSRNASLSALSFGSSAGSPEAASSSVLDGNAGARGRDVFWLRAASPAAALACEGCSFFLDADSAVDAAAPAPAASAPASASSVALIPPVPPGGALATEAIAAALESSSSSDSSSSNSSAPFASVQSGSPAPAFAVSLLDFYGQVSTTDGGGLCEVSVAEEGGGATGAASSSRVLLPDAGRRAAVAAGRALFDRLVVTGGIGSEVPLRVGCVPSPAAGKLVLLSTVPRAVTAAASGGGGSQETTSQLVDVPASLPALPLRLSVGECGRGTQAPPPESKVPYPVCSPCAFGTYSFDGATPCAPCRDGALCPGGAQGTATPVLTYAGYWRSTNESDAPLFPCPGAAQCRGIPQGGGGGGASGASGSSSSSSNSSLLSTALSSSSSQFDGSAAGDDSCVPGSRGPLCAVCAKDFYKFSGACRSCGDVASGKLLVAAAAAVLSLFLVAIFARSWGGNDVGPGPMTKVKIFMNHVQVLSLLRDYDLLWPQATFEALGWADALNLGVSVAAPECFVTGFGFWHYYFFSEAAPVAAIALCVGVYLCARAVKKRADRRAEALERAGVVFVSDEVAAAAAETEAETEATADGATPPPPPPPPPTLSKEEQRLRALKRSASRAEALQSRCWKNAFWLVTLLYPRAAQAALQVFSLQRLDVGTFLAADLNVLVRPPASGPRACGAARLLRNGKCPLTTTFKLMIPVGGAVLAFVGLAIPAFFFLALWRNRTKLDQPETRARYGFLYVGLRLVYWDTFDTVRKLAVAAVPVFVGAQPTGSLQALVGQIIIVGTAAAVLALKPYAAAEDNWLVAASQAALFLLLLSGGALKWARLGSWATNAVASAQLALSVGLGAALVLLVVWRYGGSAVRGARKGAKEAWGLASKHGGRVFGRRGGQRRKKRLPSASAAKKGSSLVSGGKSGKSGKVAPSRGSGSGDAEIGTAGAAAAGASSFEAKLRLKEKEKGKQRANEGGSSGNAPRPSTAAAAAAAANNAADAPSSSTQLLRAESAAGSGDSTAALLSPRGLY